MSNPPSAAVVALDQRQQELSQDVVIPKPGRGYRPTVGDLILSLDIQYEDDRAHVGADIHRWGIGHVDTFAGVAPASFPYVPGHFCFREGPPILAMVERLLNDGHAPSVIIVDGHGLAHPRFFGVACWLGVATGLPTIGSAKRNLVRFHGQPSRQRGSTREVYVGERLVGHVLRTQDGVKPIHVSPGHLVCHGQALACILGLPGPYRLPDPFRNADQAARGRSRGEAAQGWRDLGDLAPSQNPITTLPAGTELAA